MFYIKNSLPKEAEKESVDIAVVELVWFEIVINAPSRDNRFIAAGFFAVRVILYDYIATMHTVKALNYVANINCR